ncbi:class I adenylate-forming enzyme family protein [Nocardia flavorosea]|uniref:class I adenylate-forming enzyme family protein n=1 Tax=Nocardia flavorosea TaxID=53429 RepID=UPI000AF45D8B|nr:class I adenylate-forming enzyme family protein [Nocardia flavorosea]
MTGTRHEEDPGSAFAAHLAGRIAEYGERPCIEFEQRWYSGTEIAACIDAVDHAMTPAGSEPGARVGIVVRNRIPHAASVLGFVAGRRPVAMINSYQSPGSLAAEVERLGLSAVLAAAEDWTEPVRAACTRIGSAGISLTAGPQWVETVVTGDPSARRPCREEAGLHILTSGTTGPPERVPIGTAALAHTVLSMTGGLPAAPRDPPGLMFWPFGSIGICQLLDAPYQGKADDPAGEVRGRAVGQGREELPDPAHRSPAGQTAHAARRRRGAGGPVLAGVPARRIGPAGPGTARGVRTPIRRCPAVAYGATEFAGSVCAWTPDLYREFGAVKAGSAGRPLPGAEVRILDPETGDEVPAGERGVLAARVEAVGPDFLRTTDLA